MAASTPLTQQGYTYRYRRIPAGPSAGRETPVVFLSGAFQSMESWQRFVDVFAPRSEVVLIDLPGSGSADPLPPRFDLDFLAEAVHGVLNQLCLDRADVICASYGSPIGYRFAQRFPDRLSHLVLAGVVDAITDRLRALMQEGIALASTERIEQFAEFTLRHMLCNDAARPIARRGAVQRAMRRGLLRMSPEDLHRFVWNTQRLLDHAPLDLTRPPDVPTLVFTGEHDVFTPPARCRRVAEHIPGARFTTISEADHVFHLQRFDETVALLMEFVEDRPAGTRPTSRVGEATSPESTRRSRCPQEPRPGSRYEAVFETWIRMNSGR